MHIIKNILRNKKRLFEVNMGIINIVSYYLFFLIHLSHFSYILINV